MNDIINYFISFREPKIIDYFRYFREPKTIAERGGWSHVIHRGKEFLMKDWEEKDEATVYQHGCWILDEPLARSHIPLGHYIMHEWFGHDALILTKGEPLRDPK